MASMRGLMKSRLPILCLFVNWESFLDKKIEDFEIAHLGGNMYGSQEGNVFNNVPGVVLGG